jgi:tartrate dehydrogenase/decarboxylase/D-malate dehydrogenase
MVMWDEIAAEVAGEFPDVTCDKMLVDAMTMRMTLRPESIDTVVATNLHADILSDLAAALAGSLGIAPTANLNPERRFPSMFEPVHGSAPPLAGKNVANPMGAILSAALMLEYLGLTPEARAVEAAVQEAVVTGQGTREIGGTLGTRETGDYIAAHIRRAVP